MSRRRRCTQTAADRTAQLDALYAELPMIECRGRCQDSCGPIDMSVLERRRIADRGVDIPSPFDGSRALVWSCPALTVLGTCAVYDIRPILCRLWGLVEAMACPYGCMPEGGWLDDTTAMEFLTRSLDIGGRPATLPGPPTELVRALMADPDVAAKVGRVMRGGRP